MTLRLLWQQAPARALADDPATGAAWDRLNGARLDLPFLDATALAAALDAFGGGRERLVVGRRAAAEAPCAMLLLAPAGALRWQTFQPSQIPLGAWVAEPGVELPALARSLLRGALRTSLAVSLTQVDPLTAPRVFDGADSRFADYIETAWLDVRGSFDDYWAARGKNLRQNLRKQRNRLAADGVRASLHVWRQPADVAAALGRYADIESRGWKAGEGTAIGAGNAQGAFYRCLFDGAARRGEARVYEYRFDDATVAMNLALLRNGTLTVLKTTYDESQPKHLSPAQLLREEELQRFFAADSDVQRVEYYGKVMEWHTRLTEQRRALYHLTCFRWAWLRRLTDRGRRAPAEAPAGAAPDLANA